jgi:orotate phosphoribosyltransferase
MQPYQLEFVEFLIKQKALLFGSYTLKSGRISPYFFNAGQFTSAKAIATLGKYYAKAIVASKIEYDILFGPAYKGIPIVTSVAIALYQQHGIDKPFCFNRKEKKTHGEGGFIVGSPLKGRVLVIDDVISSGTTFKESAQMIASHPAEMVGVVTSMDREEQGETATISAIDEIRTRYKIETINIVQLSHVIEYMKLQGHLYEEELESILSYQEAYGTRR